MFNLVRAQNDVICLECCITEEHVVSTLDCIDAGHGRAIGDKRIVVPIDDKNGVRNNGGSHGFCLNVAVFPDYGGIRNFLGGRDSCREQ